MPYTSERKNKLVKRINALKDIDDKTRVYEIIIENENVESRETGGKIIMLFNKFTDSTYTKIDKFLKTVEKSKKIKPDDVIQCDEYKPYSDAEFPSDSKLAPKLKYSNKEKNLIKKKRFDKRLAEENGTDVEYQDFDLSITESDKNKS